MWCIQRHFRQRLTSTLVLYEMHIYGTYRVNVCTLVSLQVCRPWITSPPRSNIPDIWGRCSAISSLGWPWIMRSPHMRTQCRWWNPASSLSYCRFVFYSRSVHLCINKVHPFLCGRIFEHLNMIIHPMRDWCMLAISKAKEKLISWYRCYAIRHLHCMSGT